MEGVTFESGSGGMRMEKGRGAAAAGQLLYIRAGRLCDPPLGGHFPGNSRTRVLVCGLGVFVCALHGVSPRDRWLCVLPRWRINVNVNVNYTEARPSQVKSSLYINNRQPYGSLSNVLRRPAVVEGSGRR